MAMFVCTTGDAGRWFSAMFKKTKKTVVKSFRI